MKNFIINAGCVLLIALAAASIAKQVSASGAVCGSPTELAATVEIALGNGWGVEFPNENSIMFTRPDGTKSLWVARNGMFCMVQNEEA